MYQNDSFQAVIYDQFIWNLKWNAFVMDSWNILVKLNNASPMYFQKICTISGDLTCKMMKF